MDEHEHFLKIANDQKHNDPYYTRIVCARVDARAHPCILDSLKMVLMTIDSKELRRVTIDSKQLRLEHR